jgi:hypothetical protein
MAAAIKAFLLNTLGDPIRLGAIKSAGEIRPIR